jgi:hypothetical protein
MRTHIHTDIRNRTTTQPYLCRLGAFIMPLAMMSDDESLLILPRLQGCIGPYIIVTRCRRPGKFAMTLAAYIG